MRFAVLLALWLACFAVCAAAKTARAPVSAGEIDALLDTAERARLTDQTQLVATMAKLAASRDAFTREQRERYTFIDAWQQTYRGERDIAVVTLAELAQSAADPIIRFRSLVTMVNALTLERRHEEAFALQTQVIEQLPKVTDPVARAQALGTVAQLHSQVGQFAESARYSAKLMAEQPTGWATCAAAWINFDSRFRSGDLAAGDAELDRWIEQCGSNGTGFFPASLLLVRARTELAADDLVKARETILEVAPAVARNNFPRQVAEHDVIRALIELSAGRLAEARAAATAAIDRKGHSAVSEERVEAFRILYEVAKRTGDYPRALTFHERYVAMQRAILDDAKARALAFQMASHNAAANRLEIDALGRRNEVLTLEAQLADAATANARLWLSLFGVLILSIALWAWRTKRSQLAFRRRAEQDSLTGIHSRQYFIALAEQLVRSAERERSAIAFVMIDLDHFKLINDLLGHVAGDDALKHAVAATAPVLPSRALFGRLGGEEFGVLLPESRADEGAAIAEQMRAALEQAPPPHDDCPKITASFGVAGNDSAGYDLRRVFLHADMALYQAKHTGRNRVVRYSDAVAAAVELARSTGNHGARIRQMSNPSVP